jgi:creatinine amidohydrolase
MATMRIEDLNWMDVERYLEQDDRLLLVLGACEQHGYLSLQTDVRIPLALADAASQRSGALVAPPITYGVAPWYDSYPGNVSLRLATFLQVVDDLVRAFHKQGFRRLLVINGHGGNAPAKVLLGEVVNQLTDLRLGWIEWWTSPSVLQLAAKRGLEPTHASWLEAFAFTKVGELPSGESTAPAQDNRIYSAEVERARTGVGPLGGPYEVSDEIQEALFEAALRDILEAIKALDH